jgi:hypothetical protein
VLLLLSQFTFGSPSQGEPFFCIDQSCYGPDAAGGGRNSPFENNENPWPRSGGPCGLELWLFLRQILDMPAVPAHRAALPITPTVDDHVRHRELDLRIALPAPNRHIADAAVLPLHDGGGHQIIILLSVHGHLLSDGRVLNQMLTVCHGAKVQK